MRVGVQAGAPAAVQAARSGWGLCGTHWGQSYNRDLSVEGLSLGSGSWRRGPDCTWGSAFLRGRPDLCSDGVLGVVCPVAFVHRCPSFLVCVCVCVCVCYFLKATPF